MAWMIPIRAGVIKTLPFFKKMGGWLAAEYGLSVIVEWVTGYKMGSQLEVLGEFLVKWGFNQIEDLFSFDTDDPEAKSIGEDVLTTLNTFIRQKQAADPQWTPGRDTKLTPDQLLIVEAKIEDFDTDESGNPVVVTDEGPVPAKIFFSVDYLVNVSEKLHKAKAQTRERSKGQGQAFLGLLAVALGAGGLMWYSKRGR